VFVAEARGCTFLGKRVGVLVWAEVRRAGMVGREELRFVRRCFRHSRSLSFLHLTLWMVVPVGISGEVEMDTADSRRAVVAEVRRLVRMIVADISCLADVAVARYRRCRSPDLDKVVMAVEVGRCIVAAWTLVCRTGRTSRGLVEVWIGTPRNKLAVSHMSPKVLRFRYRSSRQSGSRVRSAGSSDIVKKLGVACWGASHT
jgi:hypothetical protein